MIEESYVSFDTARMLKEAGFEANLKTRYVEEEKGEWALWESGSIRSDYNYFDDTIACPTQALAARWLREEHGMDVLVDIDTIILPTKRRKYNVKIFIDKSIYCISGGHNSYENAIEKGIQEAIKLIKQ